MVSTGSLEPSTAYFTQTAFSMHTAAVVFDIHAPAEWVLWEYSGAYLPWASVILIRYNNKNLMFP